ncbi:MAG: MATE family efflux transporter [Flavobacteriales bacterium]|jgi:MATE family multidrug resistance protein
MSSDLQLKTSYTQILKLALPICASLLVPQINFITNLIFLGGLGEQVLAIAGITGVYYLIFSVIGHGLNSGLQTLISRRAGENDPEKIGVLFQQGVLIALSISAIAILFTLFISPSIFGLLMVDPERLEMTNNFLAVRVWGLPFLLLYQLRNALLVGINKSNLLIAGTAVETIVNIIFDYGFIYGNLGMPNLGYMGAAYASILAEFAGLVVIMFLINTPSIKNKVNLSLTWIPKREIIIQILSVSAPLILQFIISVVAWEFFYLAMEHYGKRELAISSLMRTIFGFFGCFTWAFASAATAMISNVIGQGKKEEVIPLTWKITKLSLSFAFVMFVLLNIFPQTFFAIFGQDDSFLEEAIPVVRMVSSALLFMAVGGIWVNAVVGTANTRITLLSEGIAIIFYCSFVYLAAEVYRLPVYIVWMSEWVYWSSLFLVSFIYLKKGNWRKKHI